MPVATMRGSVAAGRARVFSLALVASAVIDASSANERCR